MNFNCQLPFDCKCSTRNLYGFTEFLDLVVSRRRDLNFHELLDCEPIQHTASIVIKPWTAPMPSTSDDESVELQREQYESILQSLSENQKFTKEWVQLKEEELFFAERLQLKQPHRHALLMVAVCIFLQRPRARWSQYLKWHYRVQVDNWNKAYARMCFRQPFTWRRCTHVRHCRKKFNVFTVFIWKKGSIPLESKCIS